MDHIEKALQIQFAILSVYELILNGFVTNHANIDLPPLRILDRRERDLCWKSSNDSRSELAPKRFGSETVARTTTECSNC